MNIDVTPPVVIVTGVKNGARLSPWIRSPGRMPHIRCCFGVATDATVAVTGGNRQGYGNYTATCSGGADNAGNRAPPVSVKYRVAASGKGGK